jgi:cell division protein ZapA
MPEESNLVKVSIFGQEYTVKAPADPQYIQSIAEYVNSKMKEVQDELPTAQSSTRIAILASMNITDELFNIRKTKENEKSEVDAKISSLVELIDESII